MSDIRHEDLQEMQFEEWREGQHRSNPDNFESKAREVLKTPIERSPIVLNKDGSPAVTMTLDEFIDVVVPQLVELKNQAIAEIPNRIKGVMVVGVPTLQNEMDKVSIQDLRLILAQLEDYKNKEPNNAS